MEPAVPADPTRRAADLDERLALYAMVAAAFPDAPVMAEVAVWAESIGDWNADWRCYVYGPCWSVTADCGLMQLHWEAHADKFYARGWTVEDCFNPARNIEVAREVFDTSGPSAWTTLR